MVKSIRKVGVVKTTRKWVWSKLRGSGCGQHYEEVGVVTATMNPLCRQGYQTHRRGDVCTGCYKYLRNRPVNYAN